MKLSNILFVIIILTIVAGVFTAPTDDDRQSFRDRIQRRKDRHKDSHGHHESKEEIAEAKLKKKEEHARDSLRDKILSICMKNPSDNNETYEEPSKVRKRHKAKAKIALERYKKYRENIFVDKLLSVLRAVVNNCKSCNSVIVNMLRNNEWDKFRDSTPPSPPHQ